jgi:hypothetical protein
MQQANPIVSHVTHTPISWSLQSSRPACKTDECAPTHGGSPLCPASTHITNRWPRIAIGQPVIDAAPATDGTMAAVDGTRTCLRCRLHEASTKPSDPFPMLQLQRHTNASTHVFARHRGHPDQHNQVSEKWMHKGLTTRNCVESKAPHRCATRR